MGNFFEQFGYKSEQIKKNIPKQDQNINKSDMGGGFFEKYGYKPEQIQKSNKLEQAESNGANVQQENSSGVLDQMINLAKALPASVGSTVDLLGSLYNLAAKAHNVNPGGMENPLAPPMSEEEKERLQVPYVGSLEHKIEEGLGVKKTPSYEALKFASSLALPGGAAKLTAKGAPAISKTLGAIGSTKPIDLGAAAAAGGTIEATKDSLGQLGATGLGLGAGIGTQLGAGLLKGAVKDINPSKLLTSEYSTELAKPLARAVVKTGIVNPKNFKREIFEAAKDSDIPIPIAAVTDSRLIKYLNDNIIKFPYFGDRLKSAFQESNTKFQQSMENLLDAVGPASNPEIKSNINTMYNDLRDSLPKNAMVKPDKLLTKIDDLKDKFKAFAYSEDTKRLLSLMDDIESGIKIKSKFGNITPPVPLDLLLNQKAEINRMLNSTDEGVKLMFRNLNSGIKDTIQEYGQINPEWIKKFNDTEKYYSKFAKRKELDKRLENKVWEPKSINNEEVNYGGLLKELKNTKNQNLLEKNFGEEGYKNLNKLVKVAEGLNESKKSLNPSGTAVIGTVTAFMAGLAKGAISVPAAFANLGTLEVIGRALSSNEFTKLVAKYASDPKPKLADRLKDILEKRSGMSIQAIMKTLNENPTKNSGVDKNKS
jgi:hypothetical protein